MQKHDAKIGGIFPLCSLLNMHLTFWWFLSACH